MEKRLPVLKQEFRQECQALLGKEGLAAEAEIRTLKAQLDIIAEGMLHVVLFERRHALI